MQEGHDDAGQERGEKQRPVPRERPERCRAVQSDRREQDAHGEPEEHKEVPMESDAPAQQAAKQITHAFLATRGRGDQEGRKGQPQDGGERLDHRERQFNGQDAEPILREEYGDQADPSEPEGQHEEGHYRMAGNQTSEWGIGCGSPIRTVRYGHQGLFFHPSLALVTGETAFYEARSTAATRQISPSRRDLLSRAGPGTTKINSLTQRCRPSGPRTRAHHSRRSLTHQSSWPPGDHVIASTWIVVRATTGVGGAVTCQ